jgi:hypothetical protein
MQFGFARPVISRQVQVIFSEINVGSKCGIDHEARLKYTWESGQDVLETTFSGSRSKSPVAAVIRDCDFNDSFTVTLRSEW